MSLSMTQIPILIMKRRTSSTNLHITHTRHTRVLCGDSPHYGFDCQIRTPLVYEQDSCCNQNFSNDQYPYYSTSLPQQFNCCEVCEGPHYSFNCQAGNTPIYDQGPHCKFDCQTRNQLVYEPNPSNNYDFSCFDPPPQYPIVHLPPHEMSLRELISYLSPSIKETANRHMQCLNEMQSKIDSLIMNLGTSIHEHLLNSIVYKESDDDIEVTPAYTLSLPFLATMEPTDTLLMADEVISTTPERENDEFIKSSIDHLVSILRDLEVRSVYDDLECDMPVTIPLPTTFVTGENLISIRL
nr:hypothetical protein [Tanacetum cinerariifolium]